MSDFILTSENYINRLNEALRRLDHKAVETLANDLMNAWVNKQTVFIAGNGGSSANALHIANDLHYGVGCRSADCNIPGIRVDALTGNAAVLTCLANDTGYDNIFSNQLQVKGGCGDLLIVLSGSGNSKNIINAIKIAKKMGIRTHAILGFDGGESKKLADNLLHVEIYDMQIAEDLQLIIGHLCMQWLNKNNFKVE